MTRHARPGDVDALVSLEHASFRGDRLTRRSFVRAVSSANAAVLVEVEGAGLLGYVLLFFRAGSGVARLYSVAVDAAARGRGVGRSLVAAAEREAARRGRTVMRLEVREDNDASLALFRGSGYREFARTRDYYEDGATALRFEKALGRGGDARDRGRSGRKAA